VLKIEWFPAGTAVLSKLKPLAVVVIGLPTWTPSASETKGSELPSVRVDFVTASVRIGYIELEFERLFIVGTYVPNSGENFKVRCQLLYLPAI
jgi:AP endonuclease-1